MIQTKYLYFFKEVCPIVTHITDKTVACKKLRKNNNNECVPTCLVIIIQVVYTVHKYVIHFYRGVNQIVGGQ